MTSFLKFVQKRHSYVSFCVRQLETSFCNFGIVGQQNWSVQLRAQTLDQERDVGVRRRQQGAQAAVLHPPLRELRVKPGSEVWAEGHHGGCANVMISAIYLVHTYVYNIAELCMFSSIHYLYCNRINL
jgi:hypothetical protein